MRNYFDLILEVVLAMVLTCLCIASVVAMTLLAVAFTGTIVGLSVGALILISVIAALLTWAS